MPQWRLVIKAMTPVMRAHGRYGKDLHGLEGIVPYPDDRSIDDCSLVQKLETVYAGGPGFEKFWLYDWREHKDVLFRLVREKR